MFIDLSKAFDTVGHNILLKKLEIYGISGTHLQWFQSYFSHRKQYTLFDDVCKTNYKTVKYGIPHGSILGPLLFPFYMNDLHFASDLLDPIMFVDDANLFYSNKNINIVFLKANDELQKFNEWFISNKHSFNVKKTQMLDFPQT